MQKEMKRAKIAAWGLLCSLLLCAFSTLTVSAQSLSSNQLLDLQAFGKNDYPCGVLQGACKNDTGRSGSGKRHYHEPVSRRAGGPLGGRLH